MTLCPPNPRNPAEGDCPTCGLRNVNPGQLLCPPCWREVPRELQRDVLSTWRRYRRFAGFSAVPEAQRSDKIAAREAYQAARDAAIASVP